jgi:hypothetical protein
MKYRKRPVVIEAYQVPPNDLKQRDPMPPWLMKAMDDKQVVAYPVESYLSISTLEGMMKAQVGDWIIQGVKGELYPCKPDIFAATYEPA